MEKKINVEEIVKEIQRKIDKGPEDSFFTSRYYDFFDHLKACSQIVIVGAGAWGSALYEHLLRNNILSVVCFADNAYEKYPGGLLEKEVLSMEQAGKKYSDAEFIITPRLYRLPLLKQLVNSGTDINRIEVFDAENMGLKI